jgi:hypothetical protein
MASASRMANRRTANSGQPIWCAGQSCLSRSSNQTNESDQKNQTNQIDQMNQLPAMCRGMLDCKTLKALLQGP